jgi:hypothetical protein
MNRVGAATRCRRQALSAARNPRFSLPRASRCERHTKLARNAGNRTRSFPVGAEANRVAGLVCGVLIPSPGTLGTRLGCRPGRVCVTQRPEQRGATCSSRRRVAVGAGARRKKVGKTCCGFCESVRRPSAQATQDAPDAVCHPTQNGHDHEKHDPHGLRSLRELLLLYDLQDDERPQGEQDNDLYRVKEERSERGRSFLVEDVRSEPADSKDTGYQPPPSG